MISRLKKFWNDRPSVKGAKIYSVVYAPPGDSGGVKSLYRVCSWLNTLGRCTIIPFDGPGLVHWFQHDCRCYDKSYIPDVVVYPEVHQPKHGSGTFHICYALGRFNPIQPHADLVVVKSQDMVGWVQAQNPALTVRRVRPGIRRALFEYDGRPKLDQICYMTRAHKHPETAGALRERYGDKVVEVIGKTEAEVAEILKGAKVFVWRGYETEGSPRPPKEALVAGCHVVGLAAEMDEKHGIGFGLRCADVDELLRVAGQALALPVPDAAQRATVWDDQNEAADWFALMKTLKLPPRR